MTLRNAQAADWRSKLWTSSKPETNSVSQAADARKRVTTRLRSSLTTAREFSTYPAGFGERPFLRAPALPRI